jgi:secreted trypsin-like serine protease
MVTRDWFLTAAHCIVDPDVSIYRVAVGATNLTAGSVDGGQRRRVQDIVVHPAYDA